MVPRPSPSGQRCLGSCREGTLPPTASSRVLCDSGFVLGLREGGRRAAASLCSPQRTAGRGCLGSPTFPSHPVPRQSLEMHGALLPRVQTSKQRLSVPPEIAIWAQGLESVKEKGESPSCCLVPAEAGAKQPSASEVSVPSPVPAVWSPRSPLAQGLLRPSQCVPGLCSFRGAGGPCRKGGLAGWFTPVGRVCSEALKQGHLGGHLRLGERYPVLRDLVSPVCFQAVW